ncbi:hypothetical protein AVEN_72196-1 [Araneus ventricosus]|uniref:Uncharacterized protein n=1 Tax=Araneus ventricosus TaxID=182803 RepID=A0A4Y2PZW2_ARAVE|nr:hypothetical protein AVEN_72196-1 [Araneus ventricosus]
MPAWCESMERGILSQMSSASSESGWKFGGPSQNIPQVALKRAVNITKINLLYFIHFSQFVFHCWNGTGCPLSGSHESLGSNFIGAHLLFHIDISRWISTP